MTKNTSETVIEAIGIGGAGCNAIDHMIREGVMGVEFIAANTDAQALKRSVAHRKLCLGTTGSGAGGKPEVGRDAAAGAREQIAEALKRADMVFIVAGMGGGTGTGAAPVVAEIAHGMGVLTVAVVARPFGFEGERIKTAEAGIVELQKHVDSLIVVSNERLMDALGENVSMIEDFKAADEALRHVVGGIAEIMNFPGFVNVDFEDVRILMSQKGRAMMGSACASGVDRARIAAKDAISQLELINLPGAEAGGVLLNITASRNLRMEEVIEVMDTVREFIADDARIILGAVYDEDLGEDMRVTVVATGLAMNPGSDQAKRQTLLLQATGIDGSYVAAPFLDQHREPTDEQLGTIMSAVAAKARERAARADAALRFTLEREAKAALAAHRQRTGTRG
ncbi:MAG: cell division protein FtsZ [Candidatus Accumulibacter sp.]|nr:cell division protein FtsZ [Accumulibacter sp.]